MIEHHVFELEAEESSEIDLPRRVRRITMTSSVLAKWELDETVAFTNKTTWTREPIEGQPNLRVLKVTNFEYNQDATFYVCVEARL